MVERFLYEQRNGSRKLMFSPSQSGGAKHMCFLGEARQRSSSQGNLDVVREIGAAAAASSPLPSFFFPTLPPLFVVGAAETAGRWFQATGGGAFWVFWVFCSFKARSGQTAKSWAKRAARSLAGARRRLRNQIGRPRQPPSRRWVVERFLYEQRNGSRKEWDWAIPPTNPIH